MKVDAEDEKFHSDASYFHFSSVVLWVVSAQSAMVRVYIHICDSNAVLRMEAVSVISEIKFSVNTCSLTHIQICLGRPPTKQQYTARRQLLLCLAKAFYLI